MSVLRITSFFLVAAGSLIGQSRASAEGAQLPEHATLPITFTETISASHSKPGDPVKAKTVQMIHLADGREVPSGATVLGHVVVASGFRYDKTPYAKQAAGALQIQFDSLDARGVQVPLHVTLRALADPITSWDAVKPKSTDLDPLSTTTQIGGDLVTPSQDEIRNQEGDVVGYNKRGGAFAHLLPNSRSSISCDGGDTEQPMSLFSANACGLYGYSQMSFVRLGNSNQSTIGLSSTHASPEIWKHSLALLETLPAQANQ